MKLELDKLNKYFYFYHLFIVIICLGLIGMTKWYLTIDYVSNRIVLIGLLASWGLGIITCIEQLIWVVKDSYTIYVLKKEVKE